ncbi:MAG: mechanosensitive ion channel family protein, partial [Alphaproteobacteria bacterium]
VSDKSAKFLTYRIMMIFGWSTFAIGFLIWCFVFGMPQQPSMGIFVSVGFYGLMALTIWQGRHAITSMSIGDGDSGPGWERFAQAWPKIAIGIVGLNWVVVQLFVATSNQQQLSPTALNTTLAILLALPMFEVALPAMIRACLPDDPTQSDGMRAAHAETQAGMVRISRIPVTIFVLLLLANLWGLNLQDVASQGVGAQFAGAMIEVFVIAIIAFGLWELMNIIADRQIAIDRVANGADDQEEQEGEGGKGGSRLGTLMPLVRGIARFFILLLGTLAILGQLGVNITPLLAGAGVMGLAIGFGAQTLVRDVLSGFFFLIDDAFRKGEYINLSEVAGTVESISIRSMQLRHHNGPLHTIPFGEIKFLTNYSRDWVMMKLPLRVTYDTDVEKLRKMIKKLGQEMLEDPELGPKFLAPLKSQGVIQMEDSAMIVRIKFMTRPGDQWGLRTKVFAKIRELFEREGIKFAHREVTVRIASDPTGEGVPAEEHQQRRQLAAAAAAREVTEPLLPPGALPPASHAARSPRQSGRLLLELLRT